MTIIVCILLQFMLLNVCARSYDELFHLGSNDNAPHFQSTSNIPSYEFNALWDLYNSTNGPRWLWHTSPGSGIVWNFETFDANPCLDNWQGIGCISGATNMFVYNITLQGYELNGTLPNSIGVFNQLHTLALDNNTGLHGSLPDSVGNLTNLRLFGLSICDLSGTLPSSISQLQHLGSLNASVNRLHGSIPDSYGNLTSLQFLLLYVNSLSHTIPASLASLSHLRVMCLQSNDLTGSLPTGFSQLSYLSVISLSKNSLSGPLPDFATSARYLQFLDLSYNYFTGIVPSGYDAYVKISFLFLNNNLLSGALSPSLSQMSNLKTFNVYSNRLTGPLINVFNASTQLRMETVDVSDNAFSGPIPSQPFSMSRLKSFSAGKNCLHGSIPLAICNLTSLMILSMDGLMSATACQQNFFPVSWNIGTYKIARDIEGGIPSCIYSLPKIKSIHLGGNGLGGPIIKTENEVNSRNTTSTIFNTFSEVYAQSTSINSQRRLATLNNLDNDQNITISASLVELSLSYNSLTGTIPSNIQQHSFINLDLANNRLSGTLKQSFSVQTIAQSLKLQINRLSGVIPSTLLYAYNINILEGNMYSCKIDENGLPQNDHYVDKYACGSNAFNNSTYLWTMIFTAFIILIIMGKVSITRQERINYQQRDNFNGFLKNSTLSQLVDKVNVWLSVLVENSTKYLGDKHNEIITYRNRQNVVAFGRLLVMERKTSSILTVVLLVIAMPAYCILSLFFSTFTHEYAWTTSAVYLTGYVPCTILVYIFVLSIAQSWYFHREKSKIRDVNVNSRIVIDRFSSRITSVTTGTKSVAVSTLQADITRSGQDAMSVSESSKHDVLPTVVEVSSSNINSNISSSNNTHGLFTYATIKFTDILDFPWVVYLGLFGIIILNMAIVLTVNIVYTFLYQSQSTGVVFILQLSVAVFKILWNSYIIPALLKWMFVILASVQNKRKQRGGAQTHDDHRSNNCDQSDGDSVNQDRTAGDRNSSCSKLDETSSNSTAFSESSFAARVTIELFITLFNNIAATFIATALFNSNCFYHVIARPDDQMAASLTCRAFQATPNGLACATFDIVTLQTSYTPPFMYSYQCASTIITSYSNIYVYMFLIVTFVDPVVEIGWKIAYDRIIKTRDKSDMMYRVFSSQLSKLLKPISHLVEIQKNENDNVVEINTLSQAFSALISPKGNKNTLFESDYFAVQLLQMFSILLTFGVIVPPIAVFAMVAILSKTFACQLIVGRFIYVCMIDTRSEPEQTKLLLDILEQDFIRFANVLVDSEWILLPFIVIFYALLLFDTLGDEVGWRNAVWLPVVICTLPFWIRVYIVLYSKVFDIVTERTEQWKKKERTEVEMSVVVNKIILETQQQQTQK